MKIRIILKEIKVKDRKFGSDETEYVKDLFKKDPRAFRNDEWGDYTEYSEIPEDLSKIRVKNVSFSTKGPDEPMISRQASVTKYSWSIITRKALIQVIELVGHKMFSVGAGSTYVEHELKKLGVDIIATDINFDNNEFGHKKYSSSRVKTLQKDALSAVYQFSKGDRTLLMSWPENKAEWTGEALEWYTELSKNNFLVVIGDFKMIGDKNFHNILRNKWKVIKKIKIPVYDESYFDKMEDIILVYKRQ